MTADEKSETMNQVKRSNDVTKILAVSDFPGGPGVKNLPANAGDTSLTPGPGRFHMLHSN